MILSRTVFFARNKARDVNVSRAEIVRGILASCTKHDNATGITGIMLFNERYMLQAIEGERLLLSHELWTVSASDRHEPPTMISFEAIDRRMFMGWTVAYAGHDDVIDRFYLATGVFPEFDPTHMTNAAALDLLEGFASLDSKNIQHSAPPPRPYVDSFHLRPSVATPGINARRTLG